MHLGNSPQQPSGMTLPDGSDLRQVTILSKGDWNRIQAQLDSSAREAERIRAEQEEKELLKQRSDNLVKNWSNTIAVSIHSWLPVIHNF